MNSRRQFLKTSCVATAAMLAGPRLFASSFAERAAAADDNILVVVQLAGGNDWLNTVVPTVDPLYRAARPRVALGASQTLRIDDRYGLHPSLGNFQRLLNEGKLAVVQGVGYEQPDLSHFTSAEIWHRADRTLHEKNGWLGRALDELYPDRPSDLYALALGGDIPPSLQGAIHSPTVFWDPSSFNFPVDFNYEDDHEFVRAAFKTSLAPAGTGRFDLVAAAGTTALTASRRIHDAADAYQPATQYPDTDFGRRLNVIASMIDARLGSRVYWVIQNADYDTHDSQVGAHAESLSDLDASLAAFHRDLTAHGRDRQVVVLVWSEFGRRVEDNASGGTDHGAAGGIFVLGTRVRGGIFGAPSSLNNLDDDGNLKHTVDFRSVYATILREWVGVDPVLVLHSDYNTLAFL
jgi:uncharacterized protein (DUF1501 family)